MGIVVTCENMATVELASVLRLRGQMVSDLNGSTVNPGIAKPRALFACSGSVLPFAGNEIGVVSRNCTRHTACL